MEVWHGLAGKKAFITAAGQGIGRAIVEAYSKAGATVVASDVDAEALASLAGLSGVTTRQVDVTDDALLCQAVVEEAPDVLTNVAGVVHHGSILECKPEEWDLAFALNVRPMFIACQAALPGMLERGAGTIINMASVASAVRGVPSRCAYGSSKGAVIALTKSIAADFIKRGIRANSICPGTVRSPSWEQRVREMAAREGISEQEAHDVFIARQPMGRIGEPAEIAALATYLASDSSAFISGQEICVDGGWSCL